MKKLSTKILAFLCVMSLLVAMTVTASAATINVNDGVYAPFWGEEWTTPETEGLWKGFYINKSDNTLRTDLIKKSPGEWCAPGSPYATIWEGINICAPSDQCDVGYLLNCVEGGQIEITLKGYMEVPGCTEVTFGIYKNNFGTMLYPESGSETVLASGDSLDINMVINVTKGDKIFFKWHSPVEVANSPAFRFTAFQAVWRSLEEGAPDPTQPSGGTEATQPSGGNGGNGGDIVIEDDDSYYLATKYEDVIVNEDTDTVTLTKKLTLKEFMESFNIKINHTIKVIDTVTTKEVTDDNAIITGDMICRVFNQGTPITNINIDVTYDTETPAPTQSDAMPGWALALIIVGAVLIVAVVVLIIVISGKKGNDMKKVLSILIAVLMLANIGTMIVSASESGAEYVAFAGGETPEWKPVYVSNADYAAANVKDCVWDAATYTAILPADLHQYERLYVNSGDPNRIVSTHPNYDIGFAFTAPEAANYLLDFAGYVPADQITVGGSDGVVMLVFDKDMNKLEEVPVLSDVATLSKTYKLAAGEKLYVFFNKGAHEYSDSMLINSLKVVQQIPGLDEAKFTPKDTSGVKVSAGAQYNQIFNVLADPDTIGLWTGFYISKTNTVEYLVPDTSAGATLKLPEALRGGDNQWMVMWEGLGNATSPIGEFIIGDYFTAPATGTVTVNATFNYQVPAPNGDGIFVTVYKNKIAPENIIIEKTLFDYETSANGKSIKAENVSVKKGDVIIFLYDKNAHYYSDNLGITAKNVTYTSVKNPDQIFNPDTSKVVVDGNAVTALNSLNFVDLLAALGADAANVAGYRADGTQILNNSAPASEVATLVFFNDVKANAPIGVYSVTAVDSLPEPPATEPPAPETEAPKTADALASVLALLLISGAACTALVIRKKR